MAGSRSQTLLRPSRDWTPLTQIGALTLSAGVITDVTRLAGVEGDGATYPASRAGVWPAATNLCANGGFETNTTGWVGKAGGGNETLARVTTAAKFGSACAKITVSGSLGYEGLKSDQNLALVNGTVYTAGAWVWCETGTVNLRLRIVNSAFVAIGTTNITATTTPQRVSVTVTATADTPFEIEVLVNGAQPGVVYYVDGVQLETGSIATPYIETDGGTASRVAGDAYATTFSSLVNPTKGWMFVRGRFGVSDAAAPAGAYGLAECSRADGTSRTTLVWASAGNQLEVARVGGGSFGSVGGTTVLTPALGDYVTGGMGWSASLIGTAANGNAFNTLADANIGGVFDRITFGSRRAGSSPFYGDILWAVIGSEDTWDTALSVLMDSFGNNDPLPHQIPRKYGPVDLVPFNGDGSAHRYAA